MTAASNEEIRRTWWEKWWRADYSWQGLASHRLTGWRITALGDLIPRVQGARGDRQATLQDLWRSEEGRLITGPDGREWTCVHTPGYWVDATPAKSAWTPSELDRLNLAIRDALARFPDGAVTSWPGPDETSIRRRPRLTAYAQGWGLLLNGAVFSSLPESLQLLPLVKGTKLAFLDPWRVRGRVNFALVDCLFEEDVNIGPTSATEVRISGATILGNLSVSSSNADRISFHRPKVSGDIKVSRFKSGGDLHLSGAFGQSITASDLVLDVINMSAIKIEGSVEIRNVAAEKIRLDSAEVIKRLNVVNLQATTLEASELSISGTTTFKTLTVNEKARFNNSEFSKTVTMNGNLAKSDFAGIDVGGRADFDGAVFGDETTFARARFQHPVSFHGVQWSQNRSHLSGVFRETRFEGFADFRSGGAVDFAAFDGANIKAEVRFDEAVFKSDAGYRDARKSAGANSEALGNLECGLRALKQAAESSRDRVREQTYYRYELMARRGRSTASLEEKLVSWIYGAASFYGSSATRPLGWVLLAWSVSTCVYLVIGAAFDATALEGWAWSGGPIHPAVFDAMNLSARATFNPFGVWSLRPESTDGLIKDLLFDRAGLNLTTRLASTTQSLVSGMLLFLTALALRRRFQIN